MFHVLVPVTCWLLAVEDVPSVAMVLSVKGDVTWRLGESAPRRLALMDQLPTGARLAVPEGGAVLLLIRGDDFHERVTGKAEVVVRAKGIEPAERVKRSPPPAAGLGG